MNCLKQYREVKFTCSWQWIPADNF